MVILQTGTYYTLMPGELYALHSEPKIIRTSPEHIEEYEYKADLDSFIGTWSNEYVLILDEPKRLLVIGTDDWIVHHCYTVLHPHLGVCYFICNVLDNHHKVIKMF